MKILHDAPQDLTILARATGTLPRNIFDTRQSAGFAGFSSILSLKTLLHDALGIELAKTETRSNWLHRPLTDKQLQYAADDVLYLIALRDHLLARCHSDAIQSWLQTERARLDDTSLYEERDPRTLYQRVKGGSRLTPRQLAILRELAAWREVEARQRDWPRAHILGDNLLIAIAQHAPTQGEHLLQLPGFPIAMPDEVTKRIITCVETGTRLSDADCPVPVQLSTKQKQREIKEQSDRLLNYIHEVCQPLGIDPALVASRSEADAFIRQNPEDVSTNAPRVSGWRAQLLSGFTR
jgi:ribonuclease D